MTDTDRAFDKKVREWIRLWTSPLTPEEIAPILAELCQIEAGLR